MANKKLQHWSKLWYIANMKIDLRTSIRKPKRTANESWVRFWFARGAVAIFLFGIYAATKSGLPLFDSVVDAALATMLIYHLCLAIVFFLDDLADLILPPEDEPVVPQAQQPTPLPHSYSVALDVPTRPPRSCLA